MSYREIPAGAIKVVLPAVPQPDSYSCGPTSLMSVAAYFGVGPEDLEEFKKNCKTSEEHGTYYGDLADYAKTLGLDASVEKDMTPERLKQVLDESVPVILSLQAWSGNKSDYDDPDNNDNGHFAVAVGYDAEDNFYFMDPSIWGRIGFLSWADLDKRWHENEGIEGKELSHHLGIVVRPGYNKPVYATRARAID